MRHNNIDSSAGVLQERYGGKVRRELAYKEFLRKEENILRAPYNPELEFYAVIKSGNIEKTKALCKEPLSRKSGLGLLSHNPLQNMRYHYAITIALIARYCIEGGLEVSTSYALSDFYIQKGDICDSFDKLDNLHKEAAIEYATRMHRLRKRKISSIHVIKCIEYIQDNLHTRISAEELANHVGLNRSYLSKLFKSETGVSVSEYIRELKIDAAKNMLLYSKYTPAEIAFILGFSGQSHFTEVFRQLVGETPKKYQSMHMRKLSFSEKEE